MTSPNSGNRSDFLGQLIERSSNDGAALQPRLPSFFESSAAMTPNGFDEEEVASIFKETKESSVNVSRASVAAQPEAERREKRDGVSPINSSLRPSISTAIRTADNAAVRGSLTTTVETIRDVVEERIAQSAPNPVNAPPIARIADNSTMPMRVQIRPPSDASELARDIGTNETRSDAEPLPSLRKAPPAYLIAEPSSAVRSMAAMREALDSETRPAAPVINVTIGRLEIRATQNSKASPKPTSTSGAQPMSLDDYLKQRGRGR